MKLVGALKSFPPCLSRASKDDEIAKEYEQYLKEAPDSPLAPRVKDALAKLKPK